MTKIEILEPKIFRNENILSGVTKRNLENFPPYGFSASTADLFTEEEILNFRRELAIQYNIELNQIKTKKQIHSDFVYIVDENDEIEDGDALITNKKNLMLMVKLADCAGILIYDKENEIIAAVHSGWRGTEKKILMKTIEKMFDNFGSNPLDLLVYISPCASGDNYEVGEEVAKHFTQSIKKIGENKFLFDNKNELLLQLLSFGIKKENIEISDICTIENNDYHSFRRDKNKSGRMGAFIIMN